MDGGTQLISEIYHKTSHCHFNIETKYKFLVGHIRNIDRNQNTSRVHSKATRISDQMLNVLFSFCGFLSIFRTNYTWKQHYNNGCCFFFLPAAASPPPARRWALGICRSPPSCRLLFAQQDDAANDRIAFGRWRSWGSDQTWNNTNRCAPAKSSFIPAGANVDGGDGVTAGPPPTSG